MEFDGYWHQIRAQIDEQLAVWIPEFFSDLTAQQGETIRQTLDAGKRTRGCLVCLTCGALGGDIEAAIPRAVAIECIQAASLVHDDYVDGDQVRRNRPATWTLEGARKAVLLADMMFATVIQKMVQTSACDGEIVARVIATIARGAYQEHLDLSDLALALAKGSYRPEFYDKIIHLKTGTLFGAAAQLGAVAAGASAHVSKDAFNFGARLGEAYQIADDLADVCRIGHRQGGSPPSISVLVPVLLYFAREYTTEVLSLLKERPNALSKFSKIALLAVKMNMRREISARLDLATIEIIDFPENSYTRLLREMPKEIIRMSQANNPS